MNFCDELYYSDGIVKVDVIVSVGIVLSCLCIVSWSRVLWLDNNRGSNASRSAANATAGNTFKYLLVKAVCDLLYFADMLYYYSPYDYHSFWGTLFGIYIYDFGLFFVVFLSSSMDLLATLGKSKLFSFNRFKFDLK
jgi:hypothetical protein